MSKSLIDSDNEKECSKLIKLYGADKVREYSDLYYKLNPDIPLSYWLPIAIKEKFSYVLTENLSRCPYCNNGKFTILGRYFYYSNIINLCECPSCGLVFTSSRVNKEAEIQHFELAYKDLNYFEILRQPCYRQILGIMSEKKNREEKRVLDIGCAMGHFLNICNKHGFTTVGLDISEKSCEYARKKFGLEVYKKNLKQLNYPAGYFDFITILDTLYYMEDFHSALSLSYKFLKKSGEVIIRLANHLRLIKSALWIERLTFMHNVKKVRSIPFHNTEHIFVFTPAVMCTILKSIGFYEIKIINAVPPLITNAFLSNAIEGLTYFINRLGLILMPSMIIIASKGQSSDPGIHYSGV